MSRKHFAWLLAVTLVVAAIAVLIPSQTGDECAFETAALLSGLEEQVNDIDWLQISAEGAVAATIVRGKDGWTVEEASGYRADWPQLHQLLSDLVAAEVAEPKTANPDYYDRLGVEDTDAPGAAGVQLAFREATGLPALILGNSAQGREGQYARIVGEAQSVLIDRELEIPRAAEDWLDRQIIDIPDSEVVEIAITHTGGETVLAKKVSADDANFELQNVPDGYEPASSYSVNSLAGGLSSLEMDAVTAEGDIDWSGAVRFRLVTADGLNVEADMVELAEGEDEQHWLRIEAGVYATAVDKDIETEGGEDASGRAQSINERVSGWAYRIPEYKYGAMTKRMDDLLREVEAEE